MWGHCPAWPLEGLRAAGPQEPVPASARANGNIAIVERGRLTALTKHLVNMHYHSIEDSTCHAAMLLVNIVASA